MEIPSRNSTEQFSSTSSLQERQRSLEASLIGKAVANNIELLPENESNAKERELHAQLIRFLKFLQEHPGQALYWPKAPNEIPIWIHTFFQEDLPKEQADTRPLQELLLYSTVFSQQISESELEKIAHVKNAFRILLNEFFAPEPVDPLSPPPKVSTLNDIDAIDLPDDELDDAYFDLIFQKSITPEEEKAKKMPLNQLMTLLGQVVTEQAVALHALERAKRNLSQHAPHLALKLPVNIQSDPMSYFGGMYAGRTADEHLITLKSPLPIPLAELASSSPKASLELATSVVEHELLHARQAENLASKEAQEVSPFVSFAGPSTEVLQKFSSDTAMPVDEFSLIGLLGEESYEKLSKSEESLRLVMALLEGQVLIHQVQLMNQKIEAAGQTQEKAALEETKQILLSSIRGGLSQNQIEALSILPTNLREELRTDFKERRKKQRRYFEGRRIFAKLYKEFGVDVLPELFGSLDFGAILKLKATPELMKQYMDEPRLLPGLERSPIIQKSLQERPPATPAHS